MYQATTQEEMMDYLEEIAATSPKVHLYSLGTSNYYNFDLPIVIVTTTAIPEGATLDEAAEIIRTDGKVTFWHQAQIHANETSTGEGALAMVQEMAGSYGAPFLDRINYIAVPRFNADGSYLWQRTNADDIDMNRDHMRLVAPMTALVHIGYLKFMPEMTLDGHEYDNYGVTRGTSIAGTGEGGLPTMYNFTSRSYPTDDVESTPATSLNIPSPVTDMAMNLFSLRLHQDYAGAGLNSNHYLFGNVSSGAWTVNNAIGRAYFGNMGSLSFLVETRGLGGGIWNYPRRVFSHMVTAKSLIETAYLYNAEVKATVAAGRAEVIARGLTYDESDILALHQTASGNKLSPFSLPHRTIDMAGNVTNVDMIALNINDTITRQRSRPTAYVLPKDEEDIDFDRLLPLMEKQNIEYYEIIAGASADVRQYYRVSSTVADLRDEATVTFAEGAYVVPLAQVSGTVAAMLFEPDVNASNGYDGTVAQSREAPVLVTYDSTTSNYPYYRLEKSNPFAVLPNAANKSITTFSIAGITATINESDGTIDVTVPFGTNIADLLPLIESSGASYTPTGPQDFSSPVTYTVTAPDGSTSTYTVTVRVSPSTAKEITAFSLMGSSGTIHEGENTIAVTVPFGSDITAATPDVTFLGASYTPTGAQDFNSPVNYTVTAGDGSTRTYKVTVKVASNTAKAITWFSLNGVAGEIDETLGTITLTVPKGMDVTSAVPAVAFAGESLSPALGVAQDFTNPVAYTVTAGDGSTKRYTIMVNVAPDEEPVWHGGSSSNCNTGMAPMALALLALFGVGALNLRKK